MFTENDYNFEITTKIADEFIESHKAYNPNEEWWDHTEDILSVIESSNQDTEEDAWYKMWEETAEIIVEKINNTKIRVSGLEEWNVVEIDYNPSTHESRLDCEDSNS